MVTLIQWSSLPNSVSKFTPKKFYEIDPRLKRFAKRTDTSVFCLFVLIVIDKEKMFHNIVTVVVKLFCFVTDKKQ
jgi:hypothetical protein